MAISPQVRATVQAAYHQQCGYCGVSESWAGSQLEIDHFRPVSHSGTDDFSNLVYACSACNRFKGDYWPAEGASADFHLLHPGQDDLEAHVAESFNGRVVGLTPRGWFHIQWLHLNRSPLIELRQLRRSDETVRTALVQAQEAKVALQQRIGELEMEVARLHEIIALLSEEESQ